MSGDETRVMSHVPKTTFSRRSPMEMTKDWAELECAQYIKILNSWPNHANVCVGAFSEGLQAKTAWKEVEEVKEGKWKEHARKWNELKETWTKPKEHYRELHGNTHTRQEWIIIWSGRNWILKRANQPRSLDLQ